MKPPGGDRRTLRGMKMGYCETHSESAFIRLFVQEQVVGQATLAFTHNYTNKCLHSVYIHVFPFTPFIYTNNAHTQAIYALVIHDDLSVDNCCNAILLLST